MTRLPPTLLILGAGYTGRRIVQQARQRGWDVYGTSRAPARLSFLPADRRVAFDLGRRETWQDIPRTSHVIWCLPAEPDDAVVDATRALLHHRPALVVLGTTSAYLVPDDAETAPVIDESYPVALDRPRVRGEEFLRDTYDAIICRVSGIYGPGRHPLDWIRRGRVHASRKYVNLIHVDDLAALTLLALERGRPGEIYNVSDGCPRRWSDICEEANRRWGVPLTAVETGPPGKRLSIEKLKRDLAYRFRHPDLFEALAIEEAGKKGG